MLLPLIGGDTSESATDKVVGALVVAVVVAGLILYVMYLLMRRRISWRNDRSR
jgi:phosphate/sulfate permease